MFDPKAIDDIANRLAGAIPPGLNNLKEDLEKNFHAILQSVLGKLDLVTREEFEVQKAVLSKTRARLEELEKRVADRTNELQAAQTDALNRAAELIQSFKQVAVDRATDEHRSFAIDTWPDTA